MSLTTYGQNDLLNAMAAEFAAAAGIPQANIGKGSQLGPALRAFVIAALMIQSEIAYTDAIARLSTMQDPLPSGLPNPDVDSFVNAFWPGPGNFRLGPSASLVYVQFSIPSISTQQTVIPVGFVLGTVGGPQFTVVAGGTGYNAGAGGYVIPAGQTNVLALCECTIEGSQGNVLANTITQVIIGPGNAPPPAPFTVTNPNAYNGGTGGYTNTAGIDAEVGQALKTRFALYISGGGEGTPNSIIAAVLAVQAGLTVSYGDQVEGVFSGGSWTYTPNTVGWFSVIVNIANQGGAPPQSLLNAVTAAILNAVRPAGISFAVAPPTLVPVAIAGKVVLQPGASAAIVDAAVSAAATSFVNGIGLSQNGSATVCAFTAVAAALQAVPGVLYIDNLTLNGGTADVQAGFGAQCVASTMTFTN